MREGKIAVTVYPTSTQGFGCCRDLWRPCPSHMQRRIYQQSVHLFSNDIPKDQDLSQL